MSRLNYNKWDALELSDDSDIEVHPNVDKKSMIRWKQRDIHEKRELRKLKLHHLDLENEMNIALLERMRALSTATKDEGAPFISREIARLRVAVPDFDGKQFKDGEQPSQDHMILALLTQVVNAVEKDGSGEQGRNDRLVAELERHQERLVQRQAEIVEERKTEIAEQQKHITSEDIHVGFESKTMISNKPSAQPNPATSSTSAAGTKLKAKKAETHIETINSPSVLAAEAEAAAIGSDSSDDEDVPDLTGSALRFSKLKPLDFASCFAAISEDPSLLAEETTDALLVEAFSVAMKGASKRARECVEKALMIQYCLKLGKDGVALYFKRMTSSDPKALQMFLEDVNGTAKRIIERAHVVAAEKEADRARNPDGKEQIQLVASDPSTVITFEVPDGPPPETLEITGEDADELDPDLVREFLQRRWDYFSSFSPGLQKALQAKSLEKVNKVLGKMSVEDAEDVVKKLQEAGILSFETTEILDQTGTSEPKGGRQQDTSMPNELD
ncbi:BZ3500_MvSof-1268-A1-R1_Chr2-1g04705 [Microbotryum saponariae]|uniref:Hsp90 chaperone protein kinase-targeting subunit n=1 Tax=Microbotryum saponariae TaxID=289078 RepID=A0A2X0KI73_9BASI|nr:BZ3500_MvSof-1268-A1-R1_Chr2-1g04705 [Microbotryum saponariae]SCZ92367.1 BZ3501_MvSof-1269-A2-R1_Chr2-1g04361 [Microbotryum saponariae]